jgi:hypothetical protein
METTNSPARRYLKKLSEFIEPTFPEQNGDDFAPEKMHAALDKAAQDLVPIHDRLDALNSALGEGWCAPRVIENEVDHLANVISTYHLSRYLADTLATLQDAEADLATWQRMTPTQRDERWSEREHEKAEAAERRKERAQINELQNAFYTAMFAAGISPIAMSKKIRLTAESDIRLDATERQISNMGNHLYE